MPESVDTLHVEVIAQMNEKSFRELEAQAESAGKTAGEKGGKGLTGAMGGLLSTLPGLAATAAAAVGTALVAGVTGVVNLAMQAEDNVRMFQATLGATKSEAEALGGVAEQVFKNNFGGSLKEAAEMVGQVRSQMKGLADEDLEGATKKAAALADTFGKDVGETANAANTLMQNFGLSSQEAFDFLAKGFQAGLDSSGDFLDSVGEYSTQFKNGGASAEEFFSILETGQQGGVLGTDKAADAFKEFVVRIQDGSKTTSDGLKALGIDANKLSEDMASGQVTAADAFGLVLGKLRDTKDANTQMQAGVALLGTQFEDLGKSGALALDLTKTKMADLNGAADSVNAKYSSFGQVFAGAWREIQVALLPAGKELLAMANQYMPQVKQGIATVVPIIGQFAVSIVQGIQQGRQEHLT